jgi:hypothetical protein
VTPEVPHLSQAFAPMLDEGDVALAMEKLRGWECRIHIGLQ